MQGEILIAIKRLRESIISGDEEAARAAARAALDALGDGNPMELIVEAIQPALETIGEEFRSEAIFLPELILSGDAAQAATDVILPMLSGGAGVQIGIVIIGSPKGDLHDIGKNIVGALLKAYGYRVVDLGVDVTPNEFVKAAEREKADIIAVSTLLSTCLPYQREIIRLLCDMQARGRFFVVCGGGPVTPEWVREIGADGYGREATDAIELCRRLLEGSGVPPLTQPVIVGALRKRSEVRTDASPM